MTFSKVGLDGQSTSAPLPAGDPVNVLTSLTAPTTSLSAVISTLPIPHDILGLRECDYQEAEIPDACPSSTQHLVPPSTILQSVQSPPSKLNVPQLRFDSDSIPKDPETPCAVIPHEKSSSLTSEKNSDSVTPSPNSLKMPTLFQRATASFLSLIGRTPTKSSKPDSSKAVPTPRLQVRVQELLAPDEPLLYGKPPQKPLVHTSDELLAAHGESSARRTLFWVRSTIQDKTIWGLADTGSCRNLINFDFFQSLPIRGTMFPPGPVTVIA